MIGPYTKRILKDSKKRYMKYQIVLFSITVPLVLLSALRPFLVQNLIDSLVETKNANVVFRFGFLLVVVMVIERLTTYIANLIHTMASNRAIAMESARIISHTLNMELMRLRKYNSGDIVSRATSDIYELAPTMVNFLPTVIFNFLHFVVISVVLLRLNVKLSIITFCSLPVYYLFLRSFQTGLKKRSSEERKRYSEKMNFLQEILKGIEVLKAFYVHRRFAKLYENKANIWADSRIKSSCTFLFKISWFSSLTLHL